jgi:predicted transcriptional regulator
MILLSGLFDGIHAQTVIGTFSDTVYLLSVFHNSGEKDNKAENYYCAVFLDKESATDSLLPLKTEECIHIRFDKRVKHLRLCHIVL